MAYSVNSSKKYKKATMHAAITLVVFLCLGVLIWISDASHLYLWIKAFHIIAVISWMAGLVYLPRLFVYHADAETGSVQSETFKIMERRLLKIIMTPAMLVSWILGFWIAGLGGHFHEIWFAGKLTAVIALTVIHLFFARSVKLFAIDKNSRSAKQWRFINEIPTVLMIFIVIMVVVKPFS